MIDERIAVRIRPLRLLILDVDGVLTDGRIIIDDAGLETKNFDVRDGHGIKMLLRSGIAVVLLSGRNSTVVVHRARELGIEEVHQGVWRKVERLEEILRHRALSASAVAYAGDDIVDIPVLKRVGFAVAVADACEEVKAMADYITLRRGGRGAVRELCELILKVQGKWEELTERYEFP
jgi:3-deoxy-D-manno-octulosonate 8-phosphate phosphatase (KDO 8-P phosphatase)